MLCSLSDPRWGQECWDLKEVYPFPGPAHSSPDRPGFSVGHIAVSLVRQPGALGRWQGVRASGRGPLKSHLRGATPTWPLRCRLFWASPEAARLPFLEQQHSRPHTVASGKWGEGKVSSLFSVEAPKALGEFLQLLSRRSPSRWTVYLRFTWKKWKNQFAFRVKTQTFAQQHPEELKLPVPLIGLFYLLGLVFLLLIKERMSRKH